MEPTMAVDIILALILTICTAYSGALPRGSEQNKAIIGGADANIEDIPYAAVLIHDDKFSCGSTIISEKYLLTAAHCVYKRNETGSLKVRVGSSFREKDGVVHEVKRGIPHPSYNSLTIDYDAGVLELEKPIEFNKYAQPIQLTDKEPEDKQMAKVSGWGRDGISSHPKQLQTIDVPIVGRTKCGEKLGVPMTNRIICTAEGKKCPFKGDSGGPIVVDGKVVGAVSFGNGWIPGATPSGYANFADKDIRAFIKAETGI